MTFYLRIDQSDDQWYGFDILSYEAVFIEGVVQWECMKANSQLTLYSTDSDSQIPFIIVALEVDGRRLRK